MSVFIWRKKRQTGRGKPFLFDRKREKERRKEKDGIDVRGIIEGKFYVFILIHLLSELDGPMVLRWIL
jgi:hypothetical protein